MAIDQYTLKALAAAFSNFAKTDLSVSEDAALLYDSLKGEGVHMGEVAITLLRAALEKGDAWFGGEDFSIKDADGEEILDVSDVDGNSDEAKVSASSCGHGTYFFKIGWKLEDDEFREYIATSKIAINAEY